MHGKIVLSCPMSTLESRTTAEPQSNLDELGGVPGVAGHQPLGVVEPGQEPGQAVETGGDGLYEALQHTVVVAVGLEQLQLFLGGKGTSSLLFWHCFYFLISTAKQNMKDRPAAQTELCS